MEMAFCGFVCPKCGAGLKKEGKAFRCCGGHSYDIARSGYVNLLLNQQKKEKRHGDDRLMVRARQQFLGKGYYDPLMQRLKELVLRHASDGMTLLDAGCGECSYTAAILDGLYKTGISCRMLGVDISKDAVDIGAKRSQQMTLAVASVFDLPIAADSVDGIVSVFAPMAAEEFLRVLKPGGFVFKVVPRPRHLWSLKEQIYDSLYENNMEETVPEGFVCETKENLEGEITLSSHEDIMNLFMMTPYFYKTSAKDQEKLAALSKLVTEISFEITVYQKKP